MLKGKNVASQKSGDPILDLDQAKTLVPFDPNMDIFVTIPGSYLGLGYTITNGVLKDYVPNNVSKSSSNTLSPPLEIPKLVRS